MASLLVAVSDSVFPNLDQARAVLSKVGAELRLAAEATPEAILGVARDADALLTTYAKITGDMIRQMKRCRIISRFGIGVDNVDIAAATEGKIVVTKVPDYCLDEVSDHAMALLLAAARKITLANKQVHAGRWEMPAVVPIHRLRGSVLGLVGFGRIPQLVAPKAKAFGMRVVASDPFIPKAVFDSVGVEGIEFAELVKISDFISIHSPLLPETKAGAALDVMPTEPPVNSPLLGRDNVIITPHTSFYSEESLVDLQTKAAEEVARVLTGQAPRNPVNPEVLQRTA